MYLFYQQKTLFSLTTQNVWSFGLEILPIESFLFFFLFWIRMLILQESCKILQD